MYAPMAEDVTAFLGIGGNLAAEELAAQHLGVVTAMARSYTRGNGFTAGEPAEDLGAVILTATARLMANPEQLGYQRGSVSLAGGFTGWSLAETFVLNRYRKRAA